MGLFNFSAIKNALSDVKKRISDLDGEISALKDQRKRLVCLPLPYEDFVEWALERYDDQADRFNAFFRANLLAKDSTMTLFYMRQRDGHETLEDFKAVYSRTCPVPFEKPVQNPGDFNPISEYAFFYVFKDVIVKAIRVLMDKEIKPKWPKEVGPARAERIQQLEKIEARLSNLVADRDQINHELSSAVQ